MAIEDDLKMHARLTYRWFELPEDFRREGYGEFNKLLDAHRWHEAELMVEKREKAVTRA